MAYGGRVGQGRHLIYVLGPIGLYMYCHSITVTDKYLNVIMIREMEHVFLNYFIMHLYNFIRAKLGFCPAVYTHKLGMEPKSRTGNTGWDEILLKTRNNECDQCDHQSTKAIDNCINKLRYWPMIWTIIHLEK